MPASLVSGDKPYRPDLPRSPGGTSAIPPHYLPVAGASVRCGPGEFSLPVAEAIAKRHYMTERKLFGRNCFVIATICNRSSAVNNGVQTAVLALSVKYTSIQLFIVVAPSSERTSCG